VALNADEKKLLAELQAREAEPDADDDFEIEVYDTTAGKGARLPYSKGKGWLHSVFGIGDAPAAAGGEGGPGGDAPAAGTGGEGGQGKAAGGTGYFGRK
jgi:hypothetical protein